MKSRSHGEDEDEEKEGSCRDLHSLRGVVQLQGRLSGDVLAAGLSLSDLSTLWTLTT